MFRSIRWSLQMWHAAILAAVLAAFGWVTYRYLLRETMYNQVDEELSRLAFRVERSIRYGPPLNGQPGGIFAAIGADYQKLSAALNGGDLAAAQQAFAQLQRDRSQPGAGWRGRGGPFRSREEPRPASETRKSAAEPDAQARSNSTGAPAAGPSAVPAAEAARDRRGETREIRVALADDTKPLFEDDVDAPYYYIVWSADGGTPVKSKFAPDTDLPDLHPDRRQPALKRQRGINREVVRSRGRMNVLVGRSIEADLSALHERAGLLALAGSAVLIGGLLGGHWFARKAIKPIQAISATAADISLSNLSRRIDVVGTETELTGLARTLNQMFDRLESAFAQQVRFTADASHELRTPLAVILSHTELALEKCRTAEELRETIETCRRSALRMRSLVESLLTLARFDSGELQLEYRTFDLSRTAADCVFLVRSLAEQRKIAIRTELPPVTIAADADRVAQVITNLLTNAIRYNHEGGEVTVAVQLSGSECVLSVADTGIGIPEEHLPHLFERFFRVDAARSRKDGGVGLGLAICKSIVDAHGGQITVTSVVDRGTRFEVRLPTHGSGETENVRREADARRPDIVPAGAGA